MIIAINIIDGHGLSNGGQSLVTAKEEQGNAVLAVHFTVKAIKPAVHY